MSSSNLVARAFVLAGLVAAVSLPSIARAQSVSPERALLNLMPATASVDGVKALLNRSSS